MDVVDLMKSSSAQDQMDMMTMMLQLDRLPQLSMPYSNTPELPETEFSGGSSSTPPPPPPPQPIFHHPPITSPFSSINQVLLQEPQVSNSLLQKRTTNINSMEAMREMIFRMAVMQPIQIDPEVVKPPRRRNVRISKDPQSVAARHRRERISERIRILQRMVPGGTKMDTASMLDEAVHYVKFLKKQVRCLEEQAGVNNRPMGCGGGGIGFPTASTAMVANCVNYSSLVKACQPPCSSSQMGGSTQMLR